MKKILILCAAIIFSGGVIFLVLKNHPFNQSEMAEKNTKTQNAVNQQSQTVSELLFTQKHDKNTILTLLKENNPFILLDMSPELTSLTKLNNNEQKEYLLKRALVIAQKKGINNKRFNGKNKFTVQLIILTSFDEYGAPEWGNALSIAKINMDRKVIADIKKESLYNLPYTKLQTYIEQANFTLDSIQAGTKKTAV